MKYYHEIELHISCRVRKEVHAVTFTIISLLFSNESSTKVSQISPDEGQNSSH